MWVVTSKDVVRFELVQKRGWVPDLWGHILEKLIRRWHRWVRLCRPTALNLKNLFQQLLAILFIYSSCPNIKLKQLLKNVNWHAIKSELAFPNNTYIIVSNAYCRSLELINWVLLSILLTSEFLKNYELKTLILHMHTFEPTTYLFSGCYVGNDSFVDPTLR